MCARVEPIKSILPRFWRRSAAALLASRKAAVRLVASTRFQSSRLVAAKGANLPMPALETMASMRPKRVRARATRRSISTSLATSHWAADAPISAATRSALSRSMSAQSTCQPSLASVRAIEVPMPWPAPVTIATLPSIRPAMPPTDQKIPLLARGLRAMGKGAPSPRLAGTGQVVHVRIAAERPLVPQRVVEEPFQHRFEQPRGAQMPAQLLRGDEPVPAMGTDRQPAQHVFRTDNRERVGLERAVDGGEQHQPTRAHQPGAGAKKGAHVRHMLDDLKTDDRVVAEALPGQVLDASAHIVDGQPLPDGVLPRRLDIFLPRVEAGDGGAEPR